MTDAETSMDLSEIEAEVESALESLDKVAAAIRPMRREKFRRDDLILDAWNLIGGARVSIRKGFEYFNTAVNEQKGGKE